MAAVLALLLVLYVHAAVAQREGDLRLMEGTRCGEGRVEVYHNDQWGTVCDDRFDLNEVRVICRQLGYRGARAVRHRAHFGRGTGKIWMDGLECRGTEQRLADCRFNGYGINDCGHSEDAGVICEAASGLGLDKLSIRLTCPPDHQGSCNTCPAQRGAGRHCRQTAAVHGVVEVYLRGKWQPVSGADWTRENSRVVCGMLGYPIAFPDPSLATLWPAYSLCSSDRLLGSGGLLGCSAEQLQYFQGLRTTVLSGVKCFGGETSLLDCCYRTNAQTSLTDASSVATVSCGYGLDADCFGGEKYRLRGSPLPWFGRVEVNRTGAIGTVCDRGWDLEDANVVCRSLGYGTAAQIYSRAFFGRGGGSTIPVHYNELKCTGRESFLNQCPSSPANTDCKTHAGDAGLLCNIPDRSSCSDAAPKIVRFADVPHPRDPNHLNSFLEVFHNGKWGRVCADLQQRTFAAVACRDGRARFAARIRSEVDHAYTGVKFTGVFNCSGEELSAADCTRSLTEVNSCVRGYVLLDCTHGLPDLVPDLASFQLSLQRYPYVAQIPMSYLMCAREENCLSSSADNAPRTSIRRLLRFDSLTMNYGRADFLPNAHPHEYQWHSCHMHFHSFERFIDYDILDQLGNKIAEGHKASFCLEDSLCSGGRSPSYSCQIRQGISVNCGDRYGRHLDCQWIDITGVRPGEYVIRLRVNPTRESVESDYLNNEISCRITLHDRFYIVKSCSHSDH